MWLCDFCCVFVPGHKFTLDRDNENWSNKRGTTKTNTNYCTLTRSWWELRWMKMEVETGRRQLINLLRRRSWDAQLISQSATEDLIERSSYFLSITQQNGSGQWNSLDTARSLWEAHKCQTFSTTQTFSTITWQSSVTNATQLWPPNTLCDEEKLPC